MHNMLPLIIDNLVVSRQRVCCVWVALCLCGVSCEQFWVDRCKHIINTLCVVLG